MFIILWYFSIIRVSIVSFLFYNRMGTNPSQLNPTTNDYNWADSRSKKVSLFECADLFFTDIAGIQLELEDHCLFFRTLSEPETFMHFQRIENVNKENNSFF